MLVSLATIVVILAASTLVLLHPAYLHAALDASGAPVVLGVAPNEAHALSDQTVRDLITGGGFAFAGPDGQRFYDAAEASHLHDVRVVLLAFLAIAGAAALLLAWRLVTARRDARLWAAIARGAGALAIGVVVLGLFAVLAFDVAFELFHRLFFPGGNWAFDPARQRLVQLYPVAFWQLTSLVLGTLALVVSLVTWSFARSRAARR